MISVGIVGFGYSTRTFHAPLVSGTDGLQLEAIVQRDGDEAANAYPSAEIFRSVDAMLAASVAELVVIATSNPSHFPIAKQCLQAGRHVVVDKPFCISLAQAAELVAVAEKVGRIVTVFHNRRWDGDFLTLQQLAANGELGRIVRFNSNFDRYRPTVDTNAWRQRNEPGSGILFDLGPHMLDQTLMLGQQTLGEPTFVRASVRQERAGAQVDDAFDLALDFAHGAHATLGASMLACSSRPRFSIYGERGSWVKHGLDPQEADLKRGQRPPGTRWGQEPDNAHGWLTRCDGTATARLEIVTQPGDYLACYQNVRDAIADTAQLAVTPQQCLRVVQLLELAQQSHREQRSVAVPPL